MRLRKKISFFFQSYPQGAGNSRKRKKPQLSWYAEPEQSYTSGQTRHDSESVCSNWERRVAVCGRQEGEQARKYPVFKVSLCKPTRVSCLFKSDFVRMYSGHDDLAKMQEPWCRSKAGEAQSMGCYYQPIGVCPESV